MPRNNRQEMRRMVVDVEAFATAGALAIARNVVDLNNNGGESPAAPIDRHELRGSVRVTVAVRSSELSSPDEPYPLTVPADVARAAQLGGFALGDILWLTWIARHANIIEGGRRLGSRGMIGSLQAPEGWVGLAIDATTSRMERWKYGGPVP